VNRLGLTLSLALAACIDCPPTSHVEQTYASSVMADSIQLCATEGACTILCSRAFALDAGSIDHCRILSLDHNGGAYVEVTWSEYVCTFDEGWTSDDDWSSGDDYDDGDDDYDPCSDGSCDPGDPDDYYPPDDEEPPPDDEEWPDDEEEPPDDDWMDEGPEA